MDSNSQQYDQNFADEYNQENFSESMDQGQSGGQEMNGNVNANLPEKAASDEDKKLFVGGISWDTDQKDLKEYFSKFGDVSDITIKTDPATGKSRGFCFVTFASEESVDNVLKNCPHNLKGKQIEPKRAKVRPGIKKIFVGGLDTDFPESDIRAHFEKYGKIETVELPFDKVKNQRRAFCFVTFETEAACDASVKQSKQKIGSKECDVKKATNKPDPRMGGGRGGFGGPPAFGARGAPRGRGVRGRGGPGFSQPQGWSAPGGYGGGYGAGQGYGYNQGYAGGQGYGNYAGNGGGYDYGYGGGYGNGGGYASGGAGAGGYDYSGYYNQGGGYGGAGGYGQQPSTYGKTRGRGAAAGASANAYHPYSR